jgi:hypothetical protein
MKGQYPRMFDTDTRWEAAQFLSVTAYEDPSKNQYVREQIKNGSHLVDVLAQGKAVPQADANPGSRSHLRLLTFEVADNKNLMPLPMSSSTWETIAEAFKLPATYGRIISRTTSAYLEVENRHVGTKSLRSFVCHSYCKTTEDWSLVLTVDQSRNITFALLFTIGPEFANRLLRKFQQDFQTSHEIGSSMLLPLVAESTMIELRQLELWINEQHELIEEMDRRTTDIRKRCVLDTQSYVHSMEAWEEVRPGIVEMGYEISEIVRKFRLAILQLQCDGALLELSRQELQNNACDPQRDERGMLRKSPQCRLWEELLFNEMSIRTFMEQTKYGEDRAQLYSNIVRDLESQRSRMYMLILFPQHRSSTSLLKSILESILALLEHPNNWL